MLPRLSTLTHDLDLQQRSDWLSLFPFLATRRPDTYGVLTEPVTDAHDFGTQS